ncbi:MATE family efflux transporter [Herbiconiux sp. L3-i23]|uniref:MATE family efflux transporter n=1 Tax=Herbiconiux sp. L3-i23 TaxID=2905871 RepID=UPI00206AB480|nr:MATE family efflux transporter [Herbiconiux sp. L3-i23]BDI21279.1 MATE family efflux transporter [Herbiconiux sp. L3-i23]
MTRRQLLSPLDREIARLAVPALGALVAEPLFLLTDTALVGHLGEVALGGLSIASTVLQTLIGLLIFLAYATTPAVARRLGAGDRAGAVTAGIDGMWLALGLGAVITAVGIPTAPLVVGAFGTEAPVAEAAITYYSLSLWGVPAMLVVIAASGLLRGLQDTRTTLVVAGIGFAANAVLNALLIYGAGLGIAGSALGTVIAQWAMALVYAVLAVRAARPVGARLRPGLSGVSAAALGGGWLFLRTLSLRASFVATTAAAAALGVIELATMQVAMTVFLAAAFALDALAIAGQAMIGHGIGAADVPRVVAITRRLVRSGLLAGLALGLLLALASPLLGVVFTSDPVVREALTVASLLTAAALPLAGYVFVLDGVLIGAGDGRYLALAGVVNLGVYLLALWPAVAFAPDDPRLAVAGLWIALGVGMLGARAVTLGLRARGTAWIPIGQSEADIRLS